MPWISPGPVYGLPDARNDVRFKKDPAVSISPRRDRGNLEANPGPGSYEPQLSERRTKKNAPSYTMAPKVPGPRGEEIPGPGEYETDTPRRLRNVTITGRPRSMKKDNLPGPGDYEQNPHITRQGADTKRTAVFRGRDERTIGDLNPGPGAYSHERAFDATKKSIPVVTFRGKGRDASVDMNPGPGEYNPSWGNNGKTFSIGGKVKGPRQEDTPGPGTYDPDAGYSPRAIKIAGRDRDSKAPDGPGPADYDLDPTVRRDGRKGGPAFSMGTKRDISPGGDAPGPGSYNPNMYHNAKAYTISGRLEHKLDDGNPGPGSYTPDFGKARGFTIGTKSKFPRSDSHPGPADYVYDEKLGRTGRAGGPQFAIRGRPGNKNSDQNPGPGYYENPERGFDKMRKGQPAFSMGARGEREFGDMNPGPGSYEVGSDSPRGGFKIGERVKNPSYTDTPGPGHYAINDKLSNKGKATGPNFTIGGKVKQPEYSDNPGPGQYHPENSPRGKGQPAWTMGERGRNGKASDIPGPGHYDPKTDKKVAAYTYKPGKLDRSLVTGDNVPGPTEYNIDNRAFDKTRKAQPAFSMGTRDSRGAFSDTPGPGTYLPDLDRQDLKGKGQASTIRGKPRDNSKDIYPGPAHYDPDPMLGNTVRSTKPKLPQHTIAKKSEAPITTDTPGPGHYGVVDTAPTKRKPPAFTMGARIEEEYPPKFPARNPPVNSRAVKT